MATTRYEDRILSSLGQGTPATVRFEDSQALCGAGVLFMLPSLLLQGLLKTKEVYRIPDNHYYGIESVVLTLAFMALSRIKNPEQLKQCRPGEIGRIIGLDRIPEVKCLREKIKLLTGQQQATRLNNLLVDHWYKEQDAAAEFLYIDGHVRIYYGYKANLPVKYVSRQKLCMSATTEYWVNDAQGLPVMVVMGELTEKLQTVIEQQIIPQLQQTKLLDENPDEDVQPQCTFIFDREAYEPAFFQRLWKEHRIAVITYRKNVKDVWNDECFKTKSVTVLQQTVNMQICERNTELGGFRFREIRRMSESGHQTSIISTHPTLETAVVAGRMFGRWCQENFFRYLIQDYDFDKMVNFGTEAIDMEKEVVNPEYRKRTHQLKKLREKIQRVEAKFYPLVQQAMDEPIEAIPVITNKQMEYKITIDRYRACEKEIIAQRTLLQPKIKLCQMPQQKRYNKLKTESKMLMNVIKMICYRAESAVANWSIPFLSKADDEKRMLVKQIICANADLTPDYENNTLTISLHSLSAPRFNIAAFELSKLLNETETVFPGTNLRLIYKITAFPNCER
ncbi:MAG: hypothetical protein V1904_01380 [Bacteroidota bacterium]